MSTIIVLGAVLASLYDFLVRGPQGNANFLIDYACIICAVFWVLLEINSGEQ